MIILKYDIYQIELHYLINDSTDSICSSTELVFKNIKILLGIAIISWKITKFASNSKY